jgi:hypothetical protein
MSTDSKQPTWKRKTTEKRSDTRARRVADHRARLRNEGAARGMAGLADAEWNILRSVIAGLPPERREEVWSHTAEILRRISEKTAAQGT